MAVFSFAVLLTRTGPAEADSKDERFRTALTLYSNLQDEQAVRILEELQQEKFALANTMLGVMHYDTLYSKRNSGEAVKILRSNLENERKYAPFLVGFYSYVLENSGLAPKDFVDLFQTSYLEGHVNAPSYLLLACRLHPTECDGVGDIDAVLASANDKSYLPDTEYAFFALAYYIQADQQTDKYAGRFYGALYAGVGNFYPEAFTGTGLLGLIAGYQNNRRDQLTEGLVDIVLGQALSSSHLYSLENLLDDNVRTLAREAFSQISASERRRLENRAAQKLSFLAHSLQPGINSHAAWCFSNFSNVDTTDARMINCLRQAFDDGVRCETPAIVSDVIGRDNRTRYDACRKTLLASQNK
ncbi:MAG: hypothetical protein HKN28_01885 [Alphaproteobacteria bacterium]|nr:hypothetical protein [Alphaproteobacteria bacterium]